MVSDVREYLRFFRFEINSDQDQNKTPYNFNNTVYITKKESKN